MSLSTYFDTKEQAMSNEGTMSESNPNLHDFTQRIRVVEQRIREDEREKIAQELERVATWQPKGKLRRVLDFATHANLDRLAQYSEAAEIVREGRFKTKS